MESTGAVRAAADAGALGSAESGAGIDNLKLTAHYKCVDSHIEDDGMAHIAMPTYLQSLSTAPVGPPKKDKEPVPQSRLAPETTTTKLDEVALENALT